MTGDIVLMGFRETFPLPSMNISLPDLFIRDFET
jgi:hypothetical protein